MKNDQSLAASVPSASEIPERGSRPAQFEQHDFNGLTVYTACVPTEADGEIAAAHFQACNPGEWQYDLDETTDGRWRVQICRAG